MSALIFTPNALSSSAIITAKGKDAMPYIQDFTKAMCQTQASSSAITVQDRRDGQNYTVRYINGNCWMTRNLAIGCNGSGSSYGSSRATRSLTSSDSNVSATWSTGDAGALTSGNSYTAARMQCSSTYGAWYNYAAATANTITGSSNTTIPSYSVCPRNWRLPTMAEYQGIYNESSFTATIGGHYYSGYIDGATTGSYTTTSLSSETSYVNRARWTAIAYSSAVTTGGDVNRVDGDYVRCVRSS